MKWTNIRIGGIVAAAGLQMLLSQTDGAATGPKAKNIIICIADGGGHNTYNAASLYQYGRLGCQPYEQTEWVKYSSRTISQNQMKSSSRSSARSEKNNGLEMASVWDPRADTAAAMSLAAGIPFKGYIALKKDPTDSAAAGTAMASGQKTLNGRNNYTAGRGSSDGQAMKGKTIAELAKAAGKATGVITTVQWNDATPATLGGAHSLGRSSRRDLANEMLNTDTLDVIMGAGHPEFDGNGMPHEPAKESEYDVMGGSFTWGLLKSGTHWRGWKLVETKAQFEALMSGNTPRRVVGIPRVPAATQQERRTQDWNRDGRVNIADTHVSPPFKDPLTPNIPSLVTMTKAALNILGQNGQGFYLMVEGGAVDHAAHANQPGRLIEEQVEFNNSVQAVVDWVNRYSNWNETLVIVTADHETGLIWGSNSDMVAFERLMNRGAGMTPAMWFNTTNHSSSLVPLRARGPGASHFAKRVIGTDAVYGQYVENTAIFDVMKAALKGNSLEKPGRSSEPSDTTDYGTYMPLDEESDQPADYGVDSDYTSGAAYNKNIGD